MLLHAADSDRNILWNLGPVNCTPTRRPPLATVCVTCTTRPRVENSPSERLATCTDCGIRISRSDPIATSNRVKNAAPLRQRFSQEVSSVKTTPRASRPLTCIGNRTEILRSERCLETSVFTSWTMGWVLSRSLPWEGCFLGGSAPACLFKKAFHRFENFAGRSCRVYRSPKLAAVPDAMGKPACELLHFSHSIWLIRRLYFPIVAG